MSQFDRSMSGGDLTAAMRGVYLGSRQQANSPLRCDPIRVARQTVGSPAPALMEEAVMQKHVVRLAFAVLLALTAPMAYAQCGSTLSCTSNAYTTVSSGVGSSFTGQSTYTGTGCAQGVFGEEKAATDGSAGVLGEDGGPCTPCTLGLPAAGAEGASEDNDGVVGLTNTGPAGVAGYNTESTLCPTSIAVGGFLGYKSGTNSYGVYAQGNTGATGTKSFVEPHPTDAGKEIRFVSLEGPESGTYFRGTAKTVNGFATIEVPESFRLVTSTEGLTAVVTPTGKLVQIAVISKSLDSIVVQSSADVAFDYVVNGVRKAFQDWEAIGSNQDFIPRGPNDKSFFLYPAESQRRLVATGIYNADGTVNLDTAHRMGWDQLWAAHGQPAAQAKAPAGPTADGFLRFASLHHR